MSDEVVDHVARARMDAHEDICAQRYGELQTTLASLNNRMFVAAGALIVGMGGLIVTLLVSGKHI